MNPEQPQSSGLPLPQSTAPAGAYSFAAPLDQTDSPDPMAAAPPPGAIPLPAVTSLPQHASTMTIPVITAVDTVDSDDSDEADEAWIAKAREIIEQTRDDPYSQSRAIARLRADYLKARYNKDIKISEDAAK